MNMRFSEKTLWMALFFGLILGYCLFYAPFGVNETDGGFLTGLAWQVLSGKVLYQDIIYVRPPLPIWLRALELQCLPEQFGVLGERWIFYLKLGLYSWLGAALLERGTRRWVLATFGFVVSAHCYPAMAWHTVDGILFAVLAVYLFFTYNNGKWGYVAAVFAGITLFAALLCKQSFYPLFFIAGGTFFLFNWRKALLFFAGFLAAIGLFVNYLQSNNILESFLQMTNGAAAGGQAIQHGIVDYFRITPELAVPSLGLLAIGSILYLNQGNRKWLNLIWQAWLLSLVLSYATITWLRQAHTVPFAQARVLFWVAVVVIAGRIWQGGTWKKIQEGKPTFIAVLLLGIGWSAAISWGYNLPILFATPLIWGVMQVSDKLAIMTGHLKNWLAVGLLLVLIAVFRIGHEFVYRDGKRSEMTVSLGATFPKFSGVYSSPQTLALYQDLKQLAEKYGANFTVLPAFPQANYLTGTRPPLPLDWVVNRETNADNKLIYKAIKALKPLMFIEKEYLEKIKLDPELSLTKEVLGAGVVLEESRCFLVIQVSLE